MPELPEVETIKNILKPHIIGLTIENVKINNKSVIACPCADEFTAKLKGQTFIDIIRCGKFLIFCLSSGDRLILHLRMTGCLTVANADEPLTKHTHVVFVLSDKSELRYEDVRRFGKFWFIGKWENDECSISWIDRYAYKRSKIAYIPSERNMVILPEARKSEFGNTNIRSFLFDWFEARKRYSNENRLSVLNLGINYYYLEGNEEDHIKGYDTNHDEYDILLSHASSGLQSITPLIAMVEYLTKWIYNEDSISFDQDERRQNHSKSSYGRPQYAEPCFPSGIDHRCISHISSRVYAYRSRRHLAYGYYIGKLLMPYPAILGHNLALYH